ncbi:hypothetical protein [Xenorhabdus lircayensis]|uniref:hypothetical protein n=1 Tax=Xenorhabdus lircayensis TaxID=2763499 RepID=UPI001E3F8E81|nr:hypothetical protein [Xenorhabdus lircayensis]
MANMIELDPAGWFQGHVEASFLAGSALLKSNALSKESSRRLKKKPFPISQNLSSTLLQISGITILV